MFYNGEIDKYKFDLKKHSFSTSFNESQNTNISGVQGWIYVPIPLEASIFHISLPTA